MTRRVVVLLSGGGRSLQNLVDRIAAGTLDAEVVDVIASRSDAGGLARAESAGIPNTAIAREAHTDDAAFTAALHARIDAARPDLIVLAGYLTLFPMAPRYEGRVINIHPALLPKFGGKGYYGMRVHRAVIAAGERRSGCTVHFVDGSYDRGPIILRKKVVLAPDETPESLAARVFAEECEALPEVIALFFDGRLRIDGRNVEVLPAAP